MPFVDVVLSDIELEKPKYPVVPAGRYTFKLQPGAKYQQSKYLKDKLGNSIEEVNIRFDVAEGELSGQPVFVTYPDPTATTANDKSLVWSGQALKKLSIAFGLDANQGETPVDYLNRIALTGNARITAAMTPGNYTPPDATEPRADFNIWSVGPAA